MKLLLIRNDNIGDLVSTTPLIECLHKAYPQASIDLLGNSYNIEILKYDSRLTHCWSYCKAKHVINLFLKIKEWLEKMLLLLRLRSYSYDYIIIAIPLFHERTLALARWIQPREAIVGAMPDSPVRSKLPNNYVPLTIDHNKSHALQVLTYAKALGINLPIPQRVSLMLSDHEKEKALNIRNTFPGPREKPILGIQISARRPKQRWPFATWRYLIEQVLPYVRVRLFWSPGLASAQQHPGDDLLAKQLIASFPQDAFVAEPIENLRQLMTALSASDLLLGPDGGAMHVAAGLDLPTLTLFGDVDPTVWIPYSKKSHVLKSPSDHLEDLLPQIVIKRTLEILNLIQT